MNLQRKAFEYLKGKIGDNVDYRNFDIYLDTCDVRTVAFDGGSHGSIEYNKTKFMFFFWTDWVCEINVKGMRSTKYKVDRSVIDDIISYRDHVEYEESRKQSESALESFLNDQLGG